MLLLAPHLLLYGRSYIFFSFFFITIKGKLPLDSSRPRYIQQRHQAHARHGSVRSRRNLHEAMHRGMYSSFLSPLRALVSEILSLTPTIKTDVRCPPTCHPRRGRRARSRPKSKAKTNDDQIRYVVLPLSILYPPPLTRKYVVQSRTT